MHKKLCNEPSRLLLYTSRRVWLVDPPMGLTRPEHTKNAFGIPKPHPPHQSVCHYLTRTPPRLPLLLLELHGGLTSATLAVRISDVTPNSASTDTRNAFAWAARAFLVSKEASWFSAMAMACWSRLGRNADSPTSSQAATQGFAVLIT